MRKIKKKSRATRISLSAKDDISFALVCSFLSCETNCVFNATQTTKRKRTCLVLSSRMFESHSLQKKFKTAEARKNIGTEMKTPELDPADYTPVGESFPDGDRFPSPRLRNA